MITHKELLELVNYDEYTGIFTSKKWKLLANKPDKHGYCYLHIKGKKYQAHRVAWFYVYEEWPDKYIDHKDGNRANNAIDNFNTEFFGDINNTLDFKSYTKSEFILNIQWRPGQTYYFKRNRSH